MRIEQRRAMLQRWLGVAVCLVVLAVVAIAGATRVLACSASATNCSASCSTPAGSWGQSCSATATSVTCTWTQSCGTDCTATITHVRECPREKLLP